MMLPLKYLICFNRTFEKKDLHFAIKHLIQLVFQNCSVIECKFDCIHSYTYHTLYYYYHRMLLLNNDILSVSMSVALLDSHNNYAISCTLNKNDLTEIEQTRFYT